MWLGDKVHVSSSRLCCNLLYSAAIKLLLEMLYEPYDGKTPLQPGDNVVMLQHCFILPAVLPYRPLSFIIYHRRLFEAQFNKPAP